jgi:hypothetical protein
MQLIMINDRKRGYSITVNKLNTGNTIDVMKRNNTDKAL